MPVSVESAGSPATSSSIRVRQAVRPLVGEGSSTWPATAASGAPGCASASPGPATSSALNFDFGARDRMLLSLRAREARAARSPARSAIRPSSRSCSTCRPTARGWRAAPSRHGDQRPLHALARRRALDRGRRAAPRASWPSRARTCSRPSSSGWGRRRGSRRRSSRGRTGVTTSRSGRSRQPFGPRPGRARRLSPWDRSRACAWSSRPRRPRVSSAASSRGRQASTRHGKGLPRTGGSTAASRRSEASSTATRSPASRARPGPRKAGPRRRETQLQGEGGAGRWPVRGPARRQAQGRSRGSWLADGRLILTAVRRRRRRPHRPRARARAA